MCALVVAYVVLLVACRDPIDDPAAESDEADFDDYNQEFAQQYTEFPGETSNDSLLLPPSILIFPLPMLLSACFRVLRSYDTYLLYTGLLLVP